MIFYYSIPFVIGLSIVTQGVLNQTIGGERGLGFAVLLNAAVFFVLSLALYFAATQFYSTSGGIFSVKETAAPLKWIYIIPGICGFLIVLGSPIAISNLGAATFFVLLILAQIVFSLAYDTIVLSSPLNLQKLLGAALTFAGAAIFVISRK